MDTDERTRRVLRTYLERAGLTVAECGGGPAALQRLRAGGVDLVVLDVTLLRPDGWSLLRELRRHWQMPILLLSDRGQEAERRLGFQLGADDYVTRPFSPREVAVRIGALVRRAGSLAAGALEIGGLRLSPDDRSVTAGSRPVELAPREYELLEFLARRPGRVFSRHQLLEQVWGPGFGGDPRTVDTHIRKLRAKLGPAAGIIRTAWGEGYSLEA